MKSLLLSILLSFAPIILFAQIPTSLSLPQASPLEERSITIGLTKISLEYSSVGIKEREIWGGLIPFGEVWRAGANKNTVFTVEDDVLINGQPLAAGSYGFHTIPGENEWVLIFSNNNEAWGSYFYNELGDALRVSVPVKEMDNTYEWMKFAFSKYTATSVDISLKWAHRNVTFTVEVPMEVTFAHIKNQFTSLPAFSWQGWQQGANYTLINNYELETGLAWAKESVRREANPQTLNTLARLQLKNGLKTEAHESLDKLMEWTQNWRAQFWSGEVFEMAGDLDRAKKAYQNALSLVTNANAKAMIQQRLDSIE